MGINNNKTPNNMQKKVKMRKKRVRVKKPKDNVTQSSITKKSILGKNKSGKGKFKKGPGKKITLKRVLAAIVTLGIVCFIGGFALMLVWMAQAPALDLDKFNYASATHLLDKDGNYYQELQGSENREPVSIEEIPEVVQLAFVSIEDKRFFDHGGIDLIGTGKAVLGVLTSGSTDGPGGSTITQQLIKLTHLTSETSIKRKVQEWKLAIEVEKKLSKEEILEAYLNKVNMSQAWGIQAGAQYFFKKDVNELSIAQAAVLASIINAPTYYNPLVYEDENGDGEYTLVKEKNSEGKTVLAYDENNQQRALEVVQKMYDLNHISKEEYDIAVDELKNNKIGLVENKSNSVYSYFTDAVYEQVVNDIAEKYNYSKEDASTFILNNGLTIKTTVDPDVQKALENTAKDDSIFPSQSYSAQQASEAMTKEKGEEVEYKPEVGMTVIENKTGNVIGIVGGRDKSASLSMNRATQKFQPGSSTKPLTTYGPGIDSGKITAGTTFNDTQISYGGWSPQNSGGGNQGLMTVRNALTNSINTVAVQAMLQTGTETIIPYAEKLGLDIVKDENDVNDLNPAALALGGYTHGQSTLAMASAYTTFANGGVRQTPIMYTEITDKNGEVILSNKSEKVKVFEEGTAFIITDILKNVVKGGTTYISIDGTEVAGKTGTTDENRHAWFCGYTPEYSGAVWYGYDQNVVTVDGETYNLNIGTYGGSTNGPAAFWKEAFSDIYEKKDIQNSKFASKPDDVYQAKVDGVSGKNPTSLSYKDPRGSKVYTEYFLEGKGPSGSDNIHVSAKICEASNKKATKYCPSDQVKTSVLLDLSKITYPPGVTGKNEVGSQAKYSIKGSCDIHGKSTIHSIKLTISPGSIEAGQTATATVTGTLADGSTKNISASLSSSNSSVASVSGSTITGVSSGSATITAKYSQDGTTLTASASIRVSGSSKPTVSSFSITPSSITVEKGEDYYTPTALITLSDGSTDYGSVTIESDGGFNSESPGTYHITCSISYNGTKLGNKTFTVYVEDNGDDEDEARIRNKTIKQASIKNTNNINFSNIFYSLF